MRETKYKQCISVTIRVYLVQSYLCWIPVDHGRLAKSHPLLFVKISWNNDSSFELRRPYFDNCLKLDLNTIVEIRNLLISNLD